MCSRQGAIQIHVYLTLPIPSYEAALASFLPARLKGLECLNFLGPGGARPPNAFLCILLQNFAHVEVSHRLFGSKSPLEKYTEMQVPNRHSAFKGDKVIGISKAKAGMVHSVSG